MSKPKNSTRRNYLNVCFIAMPKRGLKSGKNQRNEIIGQRIFRFPAFMMEHKAKSCVLSKCLGGNKEKERQKEKYELGRSMH